MHTFSFNKINLLFSALDFFQRITDMGLSDEVVTKPDLRQGISKVTRLLHGIVFSHLDLTSSRPPETHRDRSRHIVVSVGFPV